MLKLSTFSPEGDSSELASFLEACKNSKVLGLGEPTHGTREAFQLKHRIIRALAERGQLRSVAFECGLANGRLIDDYIRGGIGTASDAVLGQDYWCWSTVEVVELVEWLRHYNSQLPAEDRIAFYGVDVQRCKRAIPELINHLQHAGSTIPVSHKLADRAIAGLNRLGAGELNAGSAAAGQLADDLFTLAEHLPGLWPRMLCLNIARHVDSYFGTPETYLMRRDEYMASTLREVPSSRNGLTVLWAHNEHVASNPDFYGSPSMGHWLRQELGSGYRSLGMLFGTGSFRARGMHGAAVRIHQDSVAPSGFVESDLYGRPAQLVRVGRDGSDSLRRYIGDQYDSSLAAETPEVFSLHRPLSDFDMLAWIPESTPTRPIPGN